MSVDLSKYPPEYIKKIQDCARAVAKELGYYITWLPDDAGEPLGIEVITDIHGYNLGDIERAQAAAAIIKELLKRGVA